MHQRPAQRVCEVTAAQPVVGVNVLVHATGVVKEREQPYHFLVGTVLRRHPKAVFPYARPVMQAVISAERQSVAIDDGLQNGGVVVHG